MKDNELINHLDHIGLVLKEHNDMFGLLLKQQNDLMVSLKLVAISMNSLHERVMSLEKLNSISTN
jgi:hypothetical protein